MAARPQRQTTIRECLSHPRYPDKSSLGIFHCYLLSAIAAYADREPKGHWAKTLMALLRAPHTGWCLNPTLRREYGGCGGPFMPPPPPVTLQVRQGKAGASPTSEPGTLNAVGGPSTPMESASLIVGGNKLYWRRVPPATRAMIALSSPVTALAAQ
jgi:hypothetical protein